MSYIIAFVTFSNSTEEYPVECFRTDIKPADNVIVKLRDGRLAAATVVALKYLNWECKSRIICKTDEGAVSGDGEKIGLVSGDCLIAVLRNRGWTPFHSTKTYQLVLAYNNEVQTGRIWLRKNGVDFQVLSDLQPMPRTFSKASISTLDGQFVRHYLSQTTFNLFEGAVRFAQSFERNEAKYDRFFVSVGKSDRRTADIRDLKQRSSGAGRGLRDSDGGSDDWSSDWCDGMHSWYSEMMDRD